MTFRLEMGHLPGSTGKTGSVSPLLQQYKNNNIKQYDVHIRGLRLLSMIYIININSQFDTCLQFLMMKASLAGSSYIPCSRMTNAGKNSRSGNWESVHLVLVKGEFSALERKEKLYKRKDPLAFPLSD